MSVTEESRHRLHQALDRTIGEEEATTLMEHLPPVGWTDVATKDDLAHLREHVDARFETERAHVDQRFDHLQENIDQRFAADRLDTDHRFAAAATATANLTAAMKAGFEVADKRMALIEQRLAGIDARLTHQFWQFLGVIVAFGAIMIGILRYT